MPRTYIPKQAWQRLRTHQALAVQQEIRQLRDEGRTIPEIVSTLKIAKGIAVKNFKKTGDRKILKRVLEDACIDSFLILAEGLETVKSEVVQMKTRSALGELSMTPEQLGTFLRAMEKAAELIQIMSGQPAAAWKKEQLTDEPDDVRLVQARERLRVLELSSTGELAAAKREA